MRAAPGILLRLLLLLAPPFLAATVGADEPPLALGGEILVPDTTTGDQDAPEVASNEDGAFVAVWQDDGSDGSGTGILAQLFGEDGGEVGTPIDVNATTAGDQQAPAVSCDDSGDFAVAWQGPDAGGTGIFARRFEEDGSPDTAEVAVNTTTAGAQSAPSIAAAENGDFLVVWQGPDANGLGVYGRLFDHDGSALTGEFLINASTTGNQQNPQVRAFDESGGYLVVWEGLDASGSGIFLRRLTAAGGFVAGEQAVNNVTAGAQRNPTVAVSSLDSPSAVNLFVIAWQSPDSAGNGIWARVYGDDGSPLGLQQLVNVDDGLDQSEPSVAVDSGGDPDGIDFVVSWTESAILGAGRPGAAPIAGAPIFIRGRRLGGIPPTLSGFAGLETDEFAISVAGDTTGISSVAAEDDGDFVVVWRSAGQDGSGEGVYARRFAGQPIFVDGFESGDTSEWSLTVP